MGYRGKLRERQEARRLRAQGKTLQEIADALDVAKSSVSIWVRDVPFTPSKRRTGAQRRPHPFHERKLREIEACNEEGGRRLGVVGGQAFLVAGIALYAGEGSKTDGAVKLANSDPLIVAFFCRWLRAHFEIDEARLRVRVYLHQGLDLAAAERHWSCVTSVPLAQFGKAYQAVPDAGIRHNKHEYGCASVAYTCSRTHRRIMGLIRALLSSDVIPG